MSQSLKNQETLWNYLWNYISNTDAKAPETYKPQGRRVTYKKAKVPVLLADNGVSVSWLSSIQLCMWDNISGPRVEQVWVAAESVQEELEMYAARHTLCGVMAQAEAESIIESKFHVNADQGYMITSSIFTAPYLGSSNKFSLCLIIKHANINKYLIVHHIIVDRMTQLVYKLKAMLDKVPEGGMLRFTQELGKFCMNIETLFNAQLPPLNIRRTLFANTAADFDFISRAVTSHLQTHGSTVVTGPDVEPVNMFIESLALFLGPRERKRVSLAAPGKDYTPDLLLQGIIGTDIQLPDDRVIESILPTTWLDLEKRTVKQTHLFHEYGVLRKEFIFLEVDKLVGVTHPAEQNMWSARDGLFRPLLKVESASGNNRSLVNRILVEVFRLQQELREGYITQAMRLLMRKAMVLIKYVDAELAESSVLGEGVVKRIRIDLSLTSDTDFNVLLAVAEKLKPGAYVTLAGDPTTIEERFIELFESF